MIRNDKVPNGRSRAGCNDAFRPIPDGGSGTPDGRRQLPGSGFRPSVGGGCVRANPAAERPRATVRRPQPKNGRLRKTAPNRGSARRRPTQASGGEDDVVAEPGAIGFDREIPKRINRPRFRFCGVIAPNASAAAAHAAGNSALRSGHAESPFTAGRGTRGRCGRCRALRPPKS